MSLHLRIEHHHSFSLLAVCLLVVLVVPFDALLVNRFYLNPPPPPSSITPVLAHATVLKPVSILPEPSAHPDYTLPPIVDGIAPVLTRIPTTQSVVFLGIDDGGFKDPSELQMMKDNNIKATLFLSNLFILNNPTFFKQFLPAGSFIEDHTIHHYTDLPKRSYDVQKAEICDEADYMAKEYGRRPELFRPPGGSYNLTTQRAAAACGMKAVVNWIAKANGGSMQYQIGSKLRPGDIVLMHFRPVFKQDMQAFINAEKKAGLHTETLESWLTPETIH